MRGTFMLAPSQALEASRRSGLREWRARPGEAPRGVCVCLAGLVDGWAGLVMLLDSYCFLKCVEYFSKQQGYCRYIKLSHRQENARRHTNGKWSQKIYLSRTFYNTTTPETCGAVCGSPARGCLAVTGSVSP